MEIQRGKKEWRVGGGLSGVFVHVSVLLSSQVSICERVPAQPAADALAERSCPPTSGSQSSLSSIFLSPSPPQERASLGTKGIAVWRLHYVSINVRSRSISFFPPSLLVRWDANALEKDKTNMMYLSGWDIARERRVGSKNNIHITYSYNNHVSSNGNFVLNITDRKNNGSKDFM